MASDNSTVKLTFEGVDDVSQVIKKINKNLKSTEENTKKVAKSSNAMGTAVKAAGIAIGAYLVKEAAKATIELSELGAKAQLVEKNFRQFAANAGKDSMQMMTSLRKATLGMVDDMRLQQNAMKAMISGVSFDDMITAMEYVTKYAMATGDDVNVKMTTVMTGLARKSALFMDDVGIQVMGASDVVQATIDQMKLKMDQFATSEEDVALKMQNLKTQFKNASVQLGEAFIPAVKAVLPLMTKMANVANEVAAGIAAITNKTVEKNQQLTDEMLRQSEIVKKNQKIVDDYWTMYNKNEDLVTPRHTEMMIQASVALDNAKKKLKELQDQATKGDVVKGKKIDIPEIEEKKKKAKAGAKGPIFGPDEASLKVSEKNLLEYAAFVKAEEEKLLNARKEVMDEIELYGLTKSQKEIKRINDEFSEKKSLFQTHTDEWLALEQERIDRVNEIKEAEKQKTFENSEEAITFAADTAMQINNIIQTAFSQRFARERQEIDANMSKKREAIKESTLSEKQKNKELDKLDKEAAKKRHEIALGEWRTNLVMSIANTAMGVTKALSSSSPPLNFVMAALTGAAGAASIATIAANKPKANFATGGIVPGNEFSGDNVLIGANSGEMVATQSQQKRLLDVMEGRTPTTKQSPAVNISIGESPVIIQGSADADTVEEIKRENINNRQRILEMLYDAVDLGEVDSTRLVGLV